MIETPASGLVLVDTGLGRRELRRVNPTLARFHQLFDRPKLGPGESAVERVQALGFAPSDVRHIIATHLDFDHVGGIIDFPDATVHVTRVEMEEALKARGFVEKRRFPVDEFRNHRHWNFYEAQGEDWFHFKSVKGLAGLPPEIVLVPLRGHTLGQVGVGVAQADRWLFHAADSYLFRGEMNPEKRRCPAGMELYQRIFDADHPARVGNQKRLRELMAAHHREIRIFCSHDLKEYEALAASDSAPRQSANPGTRR